MSKMNENANLVMAWMMEAEVAYMMLYPEVPKSDYMAGVTKYVIAEIMQCTSAEGRRELMEATCEYLRSKWAQVELTCWAGDAPTGEKQS
jgi:hypothetical protein